MSEQNFALFYLLKNYLLKKSSRGWQGKFDLLIYG